MTLTIDYFYDFASPNAYLANQVLPEISHRTGAEVRYVPCLLGGIMKATGNKPPFVAFSDVPAKMNYMQIEMRRFIAKHQLSAFQLNPHFPLNSMLMMRGAIVAELDGRLKPYIQTVERLVWEQGLKMDDQQVFIAALSANGFDGEDIAARTQQPEVKAALIANTDRAVKQGVFGVPTFFVEDQIFFGKDSLSDLEGCLKEHH